MITTMEKQISTKLSYTLIFLSTSILLSTLLQTCPNPPTQTHFPTSTCDPTHIRPSTSLQTKTHKTQTSKSWSSSVSSYTSLFNNFQIPNNSRALIVSAGPGQPVYALRKLGVEDVIGIEIVESVPLVGKADLNNLVFRDGVFDFVFGVFLDRVLFPRRFVGEVERVGRDGGVCVVGVGECGGGGVQEVVGLFRRSRFVRAENVSVAGEKRTMIVMRVGRD